MKKDIIELFEQGLPPQAIATELQVSITSVLTILEEHCSKDMV